MLKINNLSKSFTHSDKSIVKAIDNISVEIKEGEFVVFVGPSGCGKTTILKLIAGLEKPTKGNIFLNKEEIISASNERGLIFQDFALFPWLTIYENIAFGLRLKNLSAEKISGIVAHYLKIIGLYNYKNKYPQTLSGGMQQRVAIARTLANDSKILLLDEPFGALDVQTRSQMQEFLSVLWEEEKKTMIMVTHDVDEAIYLADKIVVLSTKPGTVKEIIEVALPRPRRSEIRFNEDFLRLKKHINYIIRSESIKASLELGESMKDDTLKIGLNIWPGNAPLYLAKDKGLFTKNFLEAEIISLEKDEDRIKQLRDDRVDLLNVTLDTAVLLVDKMPDLKILMVYNRSFGGDALISNSTIESIAELKGKKIGLERDWVSHFFFLYLINKFGLSENDVTILDIKGSDIGSALIAGKIDAGVLWEPWLSKAIELTKSKILASTKDNPVIYDVLIVKKKTFSKKKKELVKLKKIINESIKELSDNKSESIKAISPYFGISEIELTEQLKKLQFAEIKLEDLKKSVYEIQEVLMKEKMIKGNIDIEHLMVE
jgi:ABC-type nitrate/sulfonate/bicarbonate transport system ATPase subunit/ABC-type amino acid transport substrate-binding protein